MSWRTSRCVGEMRLGRESMKVMTLLIASSASSMLGVVLPDVMGGAGWYTTTGSAYWELGSVCASCTPCCGSVT